MSRTYVSVVQRLCAALGHGRSGRQRTRRPVGCQTRGMARVIVIGAGVVGLSCAVRLLERGHQVVGRGPRPAPGDDVGGRGGALVPLPRLPVRAGHGLGRDDVRRARRGWPADEKTGVSMRPGTEVFRVGTAPTPWWASAVPDLRPAAGLPTGYASGFSFEAPVVEMPVYLAWLAGRVEELGGTVTRMALGGAARPRRGGGQRRRARRAAVRPRRIGRPGPRPGGVRRAGRSRPVVAGQRADRRTSCRAAPTSCSAAPRRRGRGTRAPDEARRQGHPRAGARAGAGAAPGEGARAPGRAPAGAAVGAARGGHRADGGAGRALLRARWRGGDAVVGVRGRGRGAGDAQKSRAVGSSMPRRAS